MAGHARRAVADDLAAHLRPHAVAADQCAAAYLLAAFEADRDLVAFVDEVVDLAVVLQRDEIVALAGPQIDAVDVGAMGHRIGLAEPLHEGFAERNAGDEAAAQRVAHLDVGRHPGVVHHAGLEPDPFDRPEDVGTELDAGAELFEFRRLLEYPHRKALVCQRIGGDQPADAAAGDEEGKVAPASHVDIARSWGSRVCSYQSTPATASPGGR